jgi:DNA-binding response OmpR family regulator
MRKAANKVLVIDDESQIRRFVSAGLELYGYSVNEAENGSAGLNAVAHIRPDLIILDLGLPDMGGSKSSGRYDRGRTSRSLSFPFRLTRSRKYIFCGAARTTI